MKDDELRRAYSERLARSGGHTSACPTPDVLAALVERRGSEGDRLATLDRAMACDACRRDLELLRSVAVAGERPSGTALRAFVSSPWRLAAAAGFVIAVIGIASLARRPQPGELRGAPSTLVSPAGDVAASQTREFIWRSTPGTARYEIEIFAGDGAQVFAAGTTDTTISSALVRFVPGTEYVWTVRALLPDGSQAASAPLRFRVRP